MKLAEIREYAKTYAFNDRRKELADSLDAALDSILEHTEIERVVLFGSYWTAKLQPTDIDIIVQTKASLSYETMDRLERPKGSVHLRIMGGGLFTEFAVWCGGETVVID